MDCSEYKNLHARYSDLPLGREVRESAAYADWVEHFHTCRTCHDWDLQKRVEATGNRVSDFPCVHIAYQVTRKCATHADPGDCPDTLVVRSGKGYALPIRAGGPFVSVIDHCPWCGKPLKNDD